MLDGLHDAIQGTILLPDSSANDVFPLRDEAEWEGAQPVHYLASLIAGAALNDTVVRDHCILQTQPNMS